MPHDDRKTGKSRIICLMAAADVRLQAGAHLY